MEKRGVINEETPHMGQVPCNGPEGEPTTKQAADQLQSDLSQDAIDAVADQTARNKS